MLTTHIVTLHQVFTVYNDMFDHMDGIRRALANKKTQCREDILFAAKLARQKLSKYYADVTPMPGMFLISAHILNLFRKLRSFRKWVKRIGFNPEDEIFYTTQYQQATLKYVKNQYSTKHQHVPANKPKSVPSNNLVPSAMTSASGQSSFDAYALSSDDEQYFMNNNVAETTPGRSDDAAHLLTAARLYLNSAPETPYNWVQINPKHNDYHSDIMEISSTFGMPNLIDWWLQPEETSSKSTDLSNVAHDIFSIMPHAVGVQACFSLGQDAIGWRQSNSTGDTFRQKSL